MIFSIPTAFLYFWIPRPNLIGKKVGTIFMGALGGTRLELMVNVGCLKEILIHPGHSDNSAPE